MGGAFYFNFNFKKILQLQHLHHHSYLYRSHLDDLGTLVCNAFYGNFQGIGAVTEDGIEPATMEDFEARTVL